MNRTTTLVLLVLLVIWWTTDVAAPAQGRPTQAYAPDAGGGPNHWWAPCPPGYVQIPPFGDCLPPNTTGAPIPLY